MKTEMHEPHTISENADICCPEFDPTSWDRTEHEWNNKLFLKDSIPAFLHIPLPGTFEKAITRMWKKAVDADAAPDHNDFLLLSYDPSPFKGELLMSITKEVPDSENVRLSGTFISNVFDGPYNHVPKFMKRMDRYLASLNMDSKKSYIYFTTCPKCAKKYGHNYIVVLAEV